MSEWRGRKLGDVKKSNIASMTTAFPHDTIKYLDTGSITFGKIDAFQGPELAGMEGQEDPLAPREKIIRERSKRYE